MDEWGSLFGASSNTSLISCAVSIQVVSCSDLVMQFEMIEELFLKGRRDGARRLVHVKELEKQRRRNGFTLQITFQQKNIPHSRSSKPKALDDTSLCIQET